MTRARLRAAPRVAAVALALTACGAPAPAPPPPAEVPPPAPTIAVLQALPVGETRSFGWLADERRVVLGRGSTWVVWDTTAGRVLDVHESPFPAWADVVPTSTGALLGDLGLRLSPAGWVEGAWGDAGAVISPTLDRLAWRDGPTLVLAAVDLSARVAIPLGDGEDDPDEPRGRGPRSVRVAFAPDGRSIALCLEAAVQIHDVATGSLLATAAVPARGGCSFSPDGARVVVRSVDPTDLASSPRELSVLDAGTGARLAGPFDGAREAAIDGDRLLVVTGDGRRQTLLIRSLETGREIRRIEVELRFASDAPDFRGDFVVVPGEGGGIYSAETGESVFRGDVRPAHVTRDGRILRLVGEGPDAVLVVEDLEGLVRARLELPARAAGHADDGNVWFALGESRFRLGVDGALARLGDCREDDGSPAWPSLFAPRRWAARGGAHTLLWGRCLARDDGWSAVAPSEWLRGIEIFDTSADGTTIVTVGPREMEILGEDGARRAALRFDRGEAPPCGSAQCRAPIEPSADGRYVAIARNELLRVFSGETGAILGRAIVGTRTAQLVFDERATVLAHVAESGTRTLLAVPRLAVLSRWDGAPASTEARPLAMTAHGVVDAPAAGTLRVVALDGTVRAERAGLAAGRLAAAGDHAAVSTARPDAEVVLYALPALEEVGRFAGTLVRLTPRGLATCLDDHLAVAALDVASPSLRATDAPCGAWAVLSDGVLALAVDLTVVLVRLADAASVRLAVTLEPTGPRVSAWTGGRVLGAPVDALMVRRPELVADGMVRMPAQDGSLAAWLRGP